MLVFFLFLDSFFFFFLDVVLLSLPHVYYLLSFCLSEDNFLIDQDVHMMEPCYILVSLLSLYVYWLYFGTIWGY